MSEFKLKPDDVPSRETLRVGTLWQSMITEPPATFPIRIAVVSWLDDKGEQHVGASAICCEDEAEAFRLAGHGALPNTPHSRHIISADLPALANEIRGQVEAKS